MIRANMKESSEQTMARFLNGLNHPIKRNADFQPYNNTLELVQQATKAEQQVQEDAKYSQVLILHIKNLQHQLSSLFKHDALHSSYTR